MSWGRLLSCSAASCSHRYSRVCLQQCFCVAFSMRVPMFSPAVHVFFLLFCMWLFVRLSISTPEYLRALTEPSKVITPSATEVTESPRHSLKLRYRKILCFEDRGKEYNTFSPLLAKNIPGKAVVSTAFPHYRARSSTSAVFSYPCSCSLCASALTPAVDHRQRTLSSFALSQSSPTSDGAWLRLLSLSLPFLRRPGVPFWPAGAP